MSKTTAPGWPDPTDWVKRLHDELAARQAAYDAEPDIFLKRNKAGGALGSVLASLRELPIFDDNAALLHLKDLLVFLDNLDRGRAHPWAVPVQFGGTNITTTAQGELKLWVRVACGLLIANGFRPVEAYRRIAKGLTASGRFGRDRAPVRWERVGKWCREPETKHDHRIRKNMDDWLAEAMAATLGGPGKQKASSRQIAGELVDRLWSLPHFRDRSVSGA